MKKISLSKAVEKFEEFNAVNVHLFYNKETGEFDYCTASEFDSMDDEFEDEDSEARKFDSDDWVGCPGREEIDEYGMMVGFTGTVTDSNKNGLLLNALDGKNVFRRFDETLRRVGLSDEWREFRLEAYEEIVKEWCLEHGIGYDE